MPPPGVDSAAAGCVAFVAGEASGDLLAAPLVRALAESTPSFRSAGIAGDRMIAAGCEPWHHIRELSVRGFAEVLLELPRLLRLRRGLGQRLTAGGCAALVGVDSPDFNLALETRVRAAGVPTVHYVSPSIWAWRRERIERIGRAADRILLVFPFEREIYAQAGIPATFVGHPLASTIPLVPDRAAARARLGLPAIAGSECPVVCLMPGSRRAEVAFIAPAFLDAAALLARSLPQAHFLLPAADVGLRSGLQAMIAGRAAAPGAPLPAERLHLVDGRSHDCLEACDGVLVASGTATLEAALYKRPMVVAYRTPRLSAWIHRRIGTYLPWIGLPNILVRESIVPEFLQEAATGPNMAAALLHQLEDENGRARLLERYGAIHAALRRDTTALALEAILQTIDAGGKASKRGSAGGQA